MKPLLIGLSGKAGSGKSTAADYLIKMYGYYEFAFATALKDTVGKAFGFNEDHLYGALKENIDPRWGVSPRWCLQWLGTEILRRRFPDIWIRHLRQDILDFLSENGQRPIVVTDVRFRDEAEALKKMGAVLVRIERQKPKGVQAGTPAPPEPCATGIPNHISETNLDGWEGWRAGRGNHVLWNNGPLEKLYADLEEILTMEAEKAELAKAAG